MQPVAVDVCVIGGGIAGLAAAIALRQAGASVAVLERRSDLGDPHRGDWIRPAAAKLLKAWGVTPRQPAPATSVMVEWVSRPVTRRRIRQESFFVPANQLELALRERARAMGVDLRLGWQSQMLLHENGRVAGVTAVNGADFAAFRTRLIVAADGRSSPLREQLGLGFRKASLDGSVLALEAELSPGAKVAPDVLVASVGPQGGGLAMPLPGRRLRVLVHLPAGEAERLSRQSPQTLATELPRRAPLPLGSQIDPARIRVYEATIAGHATNYAADSAVCVGEAAHPAPVPTLDSLTMAMLDAEALGRIVGPALTSDSRAINKALTKFETERWPDNERRLLRAGTALKWLRPRGALWALLLRTPLARFFLGSLRAID